jgi:hypothetical protein
MVRCLGEVEIPSCLNPVVAFESRCTSAFMRCDVVRELV